MTPERVARLDSVLARRQPDLTVFAENLHKPKNFSAMVRNCDAAGINEMHVLPRESNLRKHWRTSQGAEKWMYIKTHNGAEEACGSLKSKGFLLVAAHLSESAVDYKDIDYTQPIAIVLGTELFGVSETTLSYVDQQISIPMMGVTQSLNVSVACAIVLYEAQRQRQAAGMYDHCRLEEKSLARQRFEWLHPVLTDYCQRHGLEYPALDESGDLAEPMPRAVS
ncbi:MAG: tRNA (guanosine(18)-2'-O)-methyltransferase TrmH [Gammaproteobacteria bacterium]|nr:tRNA (guanosine(18)-2'-O)-methyltransferase TrmH [Gammaproteobacteria bacterium]